MTAHDNSAEIELIREIVGDVESAIEIVEEFPIASGHHNLITGEEEPIDKTLRAVHDSLNVTFRLLMIKLESLGWTP